ncbi:sensor histidine kinase [Nocardioides dongxiaopingii]|uniref:sensor histidine kinase n=1 Tax=Nocardioides dongxiaopingii TaxID=2576036 RepID=UPI0010C7655B|nr:sensor histidine kinase [Nocardioides dongxiaopingii]
MTPTVTQPPTQPPTDPAPEPVTPARSVEPRAGRPVAPARPGVVRRLVRDTAYLASGLVLGVVGLCVSVAGLAAGLGLLVVWVGLAVLVGTVLLSRGLAHVQRSQLRTLQGRPAPLPTYLVAPAGSGPVRRLLTPLRDPQSWLDVLWGLVGFVTGLAGSCLAAAWWAAVANGLTYWFWQQWLPEGDTSGLVELVGWGEGRRDESLLQLGVGLVALVTLPLVVRACAAVHAGVADTLLSSRARLQSEVRQVADSRTSARLAEADSLRRLERDIHDGPQQRLVRLTMDLGRARRQLAQDPDRAAAILDEALQQARDTVGELRALSRGIAPPLLVDRGLRVALEELLQRATVPVASHVEIPDRLPPHVETTVYFVVAEAFTNIAKHSGAQRAALAVTHAGGRVAVVVQDDGAGGAHVAKGSGLAGLAQRLAGVEGTLDVDSPPGGPTVLRATLPAGDDARP